MELVSIIAVLRRHWVLLIPGAALALLAGLAAMYHLSLSSPHLGSRRTTSGAAIGKSLLTTSAAPAFQLSNKATQQGTLPDRSIMLADVLATERLRTDIARRAGIQPNQLAVFGPSAGAPIITVPIAVEGTATAAIGTEPYRATISTQASPPILTVRASGPTPAGAAKVVEAVRGTITDELAPRAGGNAQIAVQSLGPVNEGLVVREPGKKIAVAVATFVFGFWCACVVVLMGSLSRLLERRRTVRHAAAV